MKQFSIAFNLLKKNIKVIFLFELIYKLIVTAIFTPLIVGMIKLALHFAGINYLTNRRIAEFLFRPSTIIILLLILLLIILIIVIEMSALIYCYGISYQGLKVNLLDMFKNGIKSTMRIFVKSNMKLILFIITIIPLSYFAILSGYLTTMNIPEYITGFFMDKFIFKIILFILFTILCFFAIRWIYSLHYFVLEKKDFQTSCSCSVKLNGKAYPSLIISYIIWEVFVVGGFFIIFAIIMFVATNVIKMFVDYSTTYSASLFLGRELYSIWLTIYTCITVPVTFAFISGYFYSRKIKTNEKTVDQFIKNNNKNDFKKIKKSALVILIISVVLNFLYINNDFGLASTNIQLFKNTMVAAHRGASNIAPENTMSAIEKAIDSMVDYVEIDVQETKDGVVILMHDSNLKRTTGLDAEISEINYRDIIKLDAGSWFSEEYKGEKIPTLYEVMELTKNKIKLNIEIKLHGSERNLIQSVVRLIEQYDMEDDCIVTSFQSSAIKEVKALNENIRTGYILKAAYGDFSELEYADALSVHHSFTTSMLVNDAHDAGIDVYVWTVNTEIKMKNMISNGVDMIITDVPELARETITSYEVNPWLVDMIKYFIGRR